MESSLREGWKFAYSVQEVFQAARRKLTNHKKRLAVWQKEKDKVMAKARKKGLSIHESVAAQMYSASNYGNTVSAMPKAQIVVDTRLQQDLAECTGKVAEHLAKIRDFEGWVQFLAAQPQKAKIELTQDDFLFFFSK